MRAPFFLSILCSFALACNCYTAELYEGEIFNKESGKADVLSTPEPENTPQNTSATLVNGTRIFYCSYIPLKGGGEYLLMAAFLDDKGKWSTGYIDNKNVINSRLIPSRHEAPAQDK